ncbi:phosphatase 2C-like domain-containing protein [Cladochytrium replicatum]|nr:phosphatase 2C-like domain-containing protein [Cladochytrium replicatum]
MGQTLSEPIRDMETSNGGDDRLVYGASSMQGWRITMEDAHTTELSVTGSTDKRIAFFGVYDGHGGDAVAKYAGKWLHKRVAENDAFLQGKYDAALKNAFLAADEELRKSGMENKECFLHETTGCTAVVAIITDDNRIICGNAGDSRCILSSDGQAVALSNDHKPTNKEETKRIVEAGGFVEYGRVNGNLALSRAIGDLGFKQNSSLPAELQVVTADPEIIQRSIVEKDEFVVLACDGIWDCMTSQEVTEYVREAIAHKNGDLGAVCEALMNKCLASESEYGSVGCDNMTVVIVGILHGKTKEEWVNMIRERVIASGGFRLTAGELVQGVKEGAGGAHDGEEEESREVKTGTTANGFPVMSSPLQGLSLPPGEK